MVIWVNIAAEGMNGSSLMRHFGDRLNRCGDCLKVKVKERELVEFSSYEIIL